MCCEKCCTCDCKKNAVVPVRCICGQQPTRNSVSGHYSCGNMECVVVDSLSLESWNETIQAAKKVIVDGLYPDRNAPIDKMIKEAMYR
jgi:hypothetical protein